VAQGAVESRGRNNRKDTVQQGSMLGRRVWRRREKEARVTSEPERTRQLKTGFSTGTAMVAAARAALRRLLTGDATPVVAVWMPGGLYYPVVIQECRLESGAVDASVQKDGGDDPDVTHKAVIRVQLRFARPVVGGAEKGGSDFPDAGIYLVGGNGVGKVTKPGLPVAVGEPAINPVPRQMLVTNLAQELTRHSDRLAELEPAPAPATTSQAKVHLAWPEASEAWTGSTVLEIVVSVPQGRSLAGRTLNPRLGIVDGISILGTTGLVKPFSHQAYEETIAAALDVAAANGCRGVVLSTGGKSEKAAQKLLTDWPPEAFVQIADFFSFAVARSARMGFKQIVHSVFFGKAVKMAEGHPYTHAHRVPLALGPVVNAAHRFGHPKALCDQLAAANTARHALQLLLSHGCHEVITEVALQAAIQSRHITGRQLPVRLLLFDFDTRLLADVSVP
jgi:cobalt-precorrin-5B (C1)-methyltransferase